VFRVLTTVNLLLPTPVHIYMYIWFTTTYNISEYKWCVDLVTLRRKCFNLLAPEFYIQILAHSVCKMWIIQEPNKVTLWNKRHFEEKNGECAACLKYSVLIVVEKIYTMRCLEGRGTPVLYIGRKVLKD
jgi:hypothetical protein